MSTSASQTTATVSITGGNGSTQFPPLAIGDKVKARQSLCAIRTAFSPDVVTVPPPPIAKFAMSAHAGRIPLTVHFTNQSTGEQITSYHWDFGGGAAPSDVAAPPDVTFPTAGHFVVTLTVTNAGGAGKVSEAVDAYPPQPVACFSAQVQPKDLTVAFSDCSSGVIDSLTWNFGDGSVTPNRAKGNITHTYPNVPEKTYTVTQVADNAGGPSAPVTHPITVTAPPPPPPTAHPQIVAGRAPGGNAITVYGSGFKGNVPVDIELTDAVGNPPQNYQTNTDGVGHFNPVTIVVEGCDGANGAPLYVKAAGTDNVWSNTVTIIC